MTKVLGLDGIQYTWNLVGHKLLLSDDRERSQYHLRARSLLAKLFPLDERLEEVSLPGSGGLFADFYIATKRTIIEIQGRQHREYIPHFHGTKLGFMQAKQRDENKKRWCEINHIHFIELPYNLDDNAWTKILL